MRHPLLICGCTSLHIPPSYACFFLKLADASPPDEIPTGWKGIKRFYDIVGVEGVNDDGVLVADEAQVRGSFLFALFALVRFSKLD